MGKEHWKRASKRQSELLETPVVRERRSEYNGQESNGEVLRACLEDIMKVSQPFCSDH